MAHKERFGGEVREIGDLPPREAWRVDPRTTERIYAPVDDRGFVLPEETVETIRAYFEDEYRWPIDRRVQNGKPDVHHFHWEERMYAPERFDGNGTPARFRELGTVKGIMPRQFHNAIHYLTLPPQMPSLEDMELHVEAYELARRVFRSADGTLGAHSMFQRRGRREDDDQAMEELTRDFRRQFKGYHMNLKQLMAAKGLESIGLVHPGLRTRRPGDVRRLLSQKVIVGATNFVPDLTIAA